MRFNVLQEDLQNAVEVSKLNYYSRITYKVTHIQNNTKNYWTLLSFSIKKDTSFHLFFMEMSMQQISRKKLNF